SSRRRHTRSDRDWSSDVCSSDLPSSNPLHRGGSAGTGPAREHPSSLLSGTHIAGDGRRYGRRQQHGQISAAPGGGGIAKTIKGKIGRASCRERVEMGGGGVAVKE